MIPDNLLDDFYGTLRSGDYSLLLGSGVSLDSCNGDGKVLCSSEELRKDLCGITGVKEGTSLSRVYSVLSPEQKDNDLILRFSNCRPGLSVKHLPNYLWQRVFTFNIDDVLEQVYKESPNKKQDAIPINFDSSYASVLNKSKLQIVHLHGWVGVPKSGFVFSHAEYVRVMRGLNPWVHLLSEIIATEPFIIAGTSLNEIDLEYYLNFRNDYTPRKGRGPSLLIEPNPDPVTESDCQKYGLTLVKATFKDFMFWLKDKYPSTPSVYDLTVPDAATLFSESLSEKKCFAFFLILILFLFQIDHCQKPRHHSFMVVSRNGMT